MDSRLLTEDGWKDVLKKSPTLKDNGLQKALAAYENLDDKEHADRLKIMAVVKQLGSNLQKAKEVGALAAKDKTAVLNYLKQVVGAAEAEQREIAKAKVLAEKGYHYQFVFARNALHVDRDVRQQTLPEALEWLWRH